MTSIVTVGGAGLGIVFRVDRPAGPGETALAADATTINGGKASNQAIGAARLGVDAAIISAVGTDVFAALVTGPLERHGVDTRGVLVDPEAATMVGAVMVDHAGENHITIAPGALARLPAAHVRTHAPRIARADVCIVSLEIDAAAALEALRIAHAAGVTTILDPAPAPAAAIATEALPLADWITPNESEARTMVAHLEADAHDGAAAEGDTTAHDPAAPLADVARRLIAHGARGVALTAGAAGVVLVSPGGSPVPVPAPTVPVSELVDTVGAGDAFDAAFAVALAHGAPPIRAAAIACEAGARICRGPGFVEALHTWHGFEVPAMMGA